MQVLEKYTIDIKSEKTGDLKNKKFLFFLNSLHKRSKIGFSPKLDVIAILFVDEIDFKNLTKLF